MTNIGMVSDSSRSFQLRNSQIALKSRLDALTLETTTGIKSDIAKTLSGDMNRIAHIESGLVTVKAYQNNASEAAALLETMQLSLGSIQSLMKKNGVNLASDVIGTSNAAMQTHIGGAADDLKSVLSALNISVAGRNAFSGASVGSNSVVDYEILMSQIHAAVGGATDPDQILERIDEFFESENNGGFSDISYLGASPGGMKFAVSEGRSIAPILTANTPEIRSAITGFAIMAYVSEMPALDLQSTRSLVRASGNRMIGAQDGIVKVSSELGSIEESVAQASVRNAATISSHTLARIGLIEADPYETAVALKETELSVQTLYALTARLSKLSLADYL